MTAHTLGMETLILAQASSGAVPWSNPVVIAVVIAVVFAVGFILTKVMNAINRIIPMLVTIGLAVGVWWLLTYTNAWDVVTTIWDAVWPPVRDVFKDIQPK